jgi:ATP phosphoribosyltransferase
VEDGVVDVAIVGENLLIEKQKDIETVQKLGFSKCRVSLAVPKDIETNDLQYFQGKKLQLLIPIPLKLFFPKIILKQIFT